MFIPLLILTIPMIVAPAWLSSLYRLEINWWENQISADNIAIQLGREDRQSLNLVEKNSAKMKSAHQSYHKALACSLIPATALKCLQLSKSLASMIRFLKWRTDTDLNSQWRSNRLKALKWMADSGKDFWLNRTPILLIRWANCPLCQMPFQWRLDSNQLRSLLILKKDSRIRSASAVFLKSALNWGYRLAPN